MFQDEGRRFIFMKYIWNFTDIYRYIVNSARFKITGTLLEDLTAFTHSLALVCLRK
jgi:hypothetical protein